MLKHKGEMYNKLEKSVAQRINSINSTTDDNTLKLNQKIDDLRAENQAMDDKIRQFQTNLSNENRLKIQLRTTEQTMEQLKLEASNFEKKLQDKEHDLEWEIKKKDQLQQQSESEINTLKTKIQLLDEEIN